MYICIKYKYMEVKIYALKHPVTQEIRYIGRTKNSLKVRLTGHLSKAKQNKFKTYKDNWILSLQTKPIIELLETVYGWEESYKREKEIIKDYLNKDYNCHVTDIAVGKETISVRGNYQGDGVFFLGEIPPFVDMFKAEKIESIYKTVFVTEFF